MSPLQQKVFRSSDYLFVEFYSEDMSKNFKIHTAVPQSKT
jgi:hypothetical protein